MTKAEIVNKISSELGIEKSDVLATVESFMSEVKGSLESGDNVYLRGFGSFVIKTRAEKIPAHNIPSFKPSKIFLEGVKNKVKVN